eukprot:TRINITY_DN23505_c0_g1_i1.p1 TRINITY_DN23505_c0_g1~~TRINITY_DN23505_c0_g1_i1.p1  ORF type:complete len:402 (-),score=65.13 TRINITY_DN23505_c0_g1_i1:656-1861(-)
MAGQGGNTLSLREDGFENFLKVIPFGENVSRANACVHETFGGMKSNFERTLFSASQAVKRKLRNHNEKQLAIRRNPLGFASISANAPVADDASVTETAVRPCCAGKKAVAGKPAEPEKKKKAAAQVSLGRSIVEGLIAGATAGVTVETALYPIDTIKTRLQAAVAGTPIDFSKQLYKGVGGNLLGVLPASAIFVGVYEPAKQRLMQMLPENLSVAAHLSAGALGGLAASLVRVPTEVVKSRMQLGHFASPFVAVQSILAKEGARNLYAGYSAFLLRDLPFDALQFAIYEQLKIAGKSSMKRDLSDPEMALAGAFAGSLTGAITTPLDVIKTRLMTQGSTGRYLGVIDCVRKTIAEEGMSAMCKGMGPRVIWIGIGGSIFFGVLEKTKQLLAAQRSSSAGEN